MFIRSRQIVNKAWLVLAVLFPLFSVPYLRISFEGLGISLTMPVFYLFLIGLLLFAFRRKIFDLKSSSNPSKIILLFMFVLIFVSYHFLSSLFAKDYIAGLREVCKIVSSAIAFFIVYFLFPRDTELLHNFWSVVIWSSAFFMAYLIYHYAFIFHSPFLGSFLDEPTRSNRNQLTGYFLYVAPFAFSYFFVRRKSLLRILPLLVIFSGIIYSGSRGSSIAALLGIGYIIISIFNSDSRKGRVFSSLKFIFILACMILIIILVLRVFVSNNQIELEFGRRYSAIVNPSTFEMDTYDKRWSILVQSWRSFTESPLFGQGLTNAPLLNNYEALTHNDYMDILLEMGIVGLTIFFFILFLLVKLILLSSIGSIKPYKNFLWISLGMRGALFAIIIFFCFMNFYSIIIFWVFLALSLVTIDTERLFFYQNIETRACEVNQY